MNHASPEPTAVKTDANASSCCSGGHAPVTTVSASTALKDPVCGMTVTEQSAHRHQHAAKMYYFCSAGCKTKFASDPAKYLAPLPVVTAVAEMGAATSIAAMYTCPMHPEIRQDHPGTCPKCGMALEPEMPSLEEDDNPELVDFTRRFWWTLPFTVVVTVLAMFGHRLGWFAMATPQLLFKDRKQLEFAPVGLCTPQLHVRGRIDPQPGDVYREISQ